MLQIFTYWTGLALTGRSAACAPTTATRPAALPRRRLFTIFILNLQNVVCRERVLYPSSATAPIGTSPCSPLPASLSVLPPSPYSEQTQGLVSLYDPSPGKRDMGMPPS